MSLLLPVLALLGGFFTAYVIGANSASPSFGPVTSSGAVTVFRASLLVGIAAFLGATLQGGAVTETVGNGLVSGVQFNAFLGAIILLTASTLIMGSIIFKYPMPTAFTVLGSVIGAGVAAGGTPNWDQIQFIGAFWLIIPVFGILIGFLTAKALRRYVGKGGRSKKVMRWLIIVLGTYTAFTAGANQSGLIVGPLIGVFSVDLFYLLLFAAGGMVLGAWTGSPRIIESVSREYSNQGPRRAIASLLSASLMAQIATLYGVPVSFNEAVISAVIGSGLASGTSGVSRSKIGWTLAAWVGAIIASSTIAYAITRLLLMMTGGM